MSPDSFLSREMRAKRGEDKKSDKQMRAEGSHISRAVDNYETLTPTADKSHAQKTLQEAV